MSSSNGFAMTGGDRPESYTRNSSYQMAIIDKAKPLVQECIARHIGPLVTSLPQTLTITDLGCSVGPNTFVAVENILEAIKLSLTHSHPDENNNNNTRNLEFQVHFSDQVLNDFNTLFKSLPPERNYHVSGVPGSFYCRLFPRQSLHIVHSSMALNWLSRAPSETNRGRIFYSRARREVIDAYAQQHAADVSRFLDARAQEVVPGGLCMLVFPARADGVAHSQVFVNVIFDMLGDCLVDLAREGVIDEKKVDEFNLPMYLTSPREFEQIVNQNGFFSIEKMEGLAEVNTPELFHVLQEVSLTFRAITEALLRMQFGQEIVDRIFDTLFPSKFVEDLAHTVSLKSFNLFALIKRKPNAIVNGTAIG